MFLGEDHVGFLLATWSDHGVYLADLDRVQFLAGFLDHGLGCTLVNDENQGVVVFNGFDGGFRAAGVLHDGVLVPGVLLLNRVRNTLGLAGQSKSFGTSESDLSPGFGLGCVVRALLDLGGSLLGLSVMNGAYLFRHLCPPNL